MEFSPFSCGELERADRPLCKDVILSLRRNDAPGNAGSVSTRQHQQQLDFSGRRMLLREWLTDNTHVKHLLRVLLDHTPDDGTDCFLLLDTIAREMSCPKRTVQTAIKKAKAEGFLIVFGPKRRRRCNTYRLRIAEIYERAKSDLRERQTKEPRADLAHDERQIGATQVPNRRLTGAYLAHRNSIETSSKPPPKHAGETHTVHPADEWGMVVEELIEYGVGDPEPAVEKARQRRCSAPFIRRVIEYARTKVSADGTKAWGGGALRKRILNLKPGQSIESLWLPVDPAYEQAQRREAEQKQEAERRRRDARREASIQADREKQDALESKFGPELDALSDSERNELITQVFDSFNQKRVRKVLRRDGQIQKPDRLQLLRHLAGGQFSVSTKQEN